MTKRTATSKGLRVKVRTLNKANETLSADLKATRISLIRSNDLIDELRTEIHALKEGTTVSDPPTTDEIHDHLCTDEVQVDAVIEASKRTGCGQDS